TRRTTWCRCCRARSKNQRSLRAIAGAVARLLAASAGAAFDRGPDLLLAVIIDQAAANGGGIKLGAHGIFIERAAGDQLEQIKGCCVESVVACTRRCRSNSRAFLLERVLCPCSGAR